MGNFILHPPTPLAKKKNNSQVVNHSCKEDIVIAFVGKAFRQNSSKFEVSAVVNS